MNELLVYADLQGAPVLVGRLFAHERGARPVGARTHGD